MRRGLILIFVIAIYLQSLAGEKPTSHSTVSVTTGAFIFRAALTVQPLVPETSPPPQKCWQQWAVGIRKILMPLISLPEMLMPRNASLRCYCVRVSLFFTNSSRKYQVEQLYLMLDDAGFLPKPYLQLIKETTSLSG
jgi:hypothetical protein